MGKAAMRDKLAAQELAEVLEQPIQLKQDNPVLLVLLEPPEMHLCLALLYSLCPEGQEELEALLEMQVQ